MAQTLTEKMVLVINPVNFPQQKSATPNTNRLLQALHSPKSNPRTPTMSEIDPTVLRAPRIIDNAAEKPSNHAVFGTFQF